MIQKYSADEARNLKSYGEFPESIKISDTVDFVGGDLDEDIEFDDVDSDESGSGREDLDDIDYIWAFVELLVPNVLSVLRCIVMFKSYINKYGEGFQFSWM